MRSIHKTRWRHFAITSDLMTFHACSFQFSHASYLLGVKLLFWNSVSDQPTLPPPTTYYFLLTHILGKRLWLLAREISSNKMTLIQWREFSHPLDVPIKQISECEILNETLKDFTHVRDHVKGVIEDPKVNILAVIWQSPGLPILAPTQANESFTALMICHDTKGFLLETKDVSWN